MKSLSGLGQRAKTEEEREIQRLGNTGPATAGFEGGGWGPRVQECSVLHKLALALGQQPAGNGDLSPKAAGNLSFANDLNQQGNKSCSRDSR